MQKNNKQFTYGQIVQKTTNNLTYGQTVQKTTTAIYIWTDSAKNKKQFTYGQTVQKKQQTITYGTDSAKKNNKTIYIWTDSAKNNNNLHMDRQCKKAANGAFTVLQTVQKNNNNLHMDRQCKKAAMEHLQCSRQCKKTTTIYIWTVHIYRICNIYEYYVHDIFMDRILCHVICATALFFTSSQQHVVGVSVVASLGTCSATAAAVLQIY